MRWCGWLYLSVYIQVTLFIRLQRKGLDVTEVMEIRFKDLIHIVDLFLVWLLSGRGKESKSGFVLFIQLNLVDGMEVFITDK